jgi:hypothetical protein
MAYLTFPFSPLYTEMTRQKSWNENSTKYDSGDVQGFTNWAKPLYRYGFKITMMTETKQGSLWDFYDNVQATVQPWLMKDPYDSNVGSVIVANSGFTQGNTTYVYNTKSYMVRPDTTSVGSFFSSLSGYVTAGSEYTIERDTGIMKVNTKATADIWRANSMSVWKKCKFDGPLIENDVMWNIFAVDNLPVIELP